MKRIILTILLAFSLYQLNFAQIKIIGDTAYYDGIKVSVTKKNETSDTLIYKKFIGKALVEQSEIRTNEKIIDLNNWKTIENKLKLNKYVIFSNGNFVTLSIDTNWKTTPNKVKYYLNGQKEMESSELPDHLVISKYYDKWGKLVELDSSKNDNVTVITVWDYNGRNFRARRKNGFYDGYFLVFKDSTKVREEFFNAGISQKAKCFDNQGNTIKCPPFEEELMIGENQDDYKKYIKLLLRNSIFKKFTEKDTIDVNIHFSSKMDSIEINLSDPSVRKVITEWSNSLPVSVKRICGEPVNTSVEFFIIPGHSEYSIMNLPNSLYKANYLFSNIKIEEMPEFPRGTDALIKYLSKNVRYPLEAVEKGISGKVIIHFIVEKNGKLSDIKVLQSVSPELDAEAIRVIKEMPDWKPGKQKGKFVPVYYTLPVLFKLEYK